MLQARVNEKVYGDRTNLGSTTTNTLYSDEEKKRIEEKLRQGIQA